MIFCRIIRGLTSSCRASLWQIIRWCNSDGLKSRRKLEGIHRQNLEAAYLARQDQVCRQWLEDIEFEDELEFVTSQVVPKLNTRQRQVLVAMLESSDPPSFKKRQVVSAALAARRAVVRKAS